MAPLAHQATGGGERAILIDRGHRVADRQLRELLATTVEERVSADDQGAGLPLPQGDEVGGKGNDRTDRERRSCRSLDHRVRESGELGGKRWQLFDAVFISVADRK